jgi:uncharacterized metal-binding protein YceD (DUF177 family)
MTFAPEFSRLISVEGIVLDKPRQEEMEATPEECAALAQRLDLRALSGLKAKLSVLRLSEGELIRIEGDIKAEVVQTCVVSLQDVHAEIRAQFEVFLDEEGKEIEGDDEGIALDKDHPDVMEGGMLDLGELVAQHLSLELDPYPRAPGVSLAAQMAEAGGEAKNRPFLQVLKGLKKEQKDE